MFKKSLNGPWKMSESKKQKWLDVKVPGSVMNDLLTNDKIQDPFYRDNEDQAIAIASKDYVYARSFEVTEEIVTQDKVVLLFEGLDTIAEVLVNGIAITKTNNMHRMYEVDVKEQLKVGTNELTVILFSPLNYINEKQEQLPLWGVGDAVEGYPHIRKGHSMFGWDWGPKIPDLGIWRDVSLLAWSVGRVDDVYIRQTHAEHIVTLDINVKLEIWQQQQTNVVIILTDPKGNKETKNVPSELLEETVSFEVVHPELWWPNGYGEQPLYKVEVVLEGDNRVLDQKDYSIGLRTIKVKHEPDQWGRSFEFEVNGISLFAMGANYIPEDNLLARNSKERTERLVKDCVEANFNMIRVWGGGHYPDNNFFNICDQYGIIVWQDFMFACSEYALTDEFKETVVQEVIDNVKRIRHHASLGIWCGNNEVEEAWVYWGTPADPMRKGDYIKLFEFIIPEILKELDPQTFYWSSSPSSGGSFVEPRDPNVGDMHYWEVWHSLKPFTEYREYFFRFCSEFGFQSFPSLKTIEAFTLPKDRNIFTHVMEKHQKNGTANGKILFYLAENFLYPKDFDSLLYASQLLQAEAIKYGVEHWRRNRGRCMGSLYWQLNDCWPVASWSSIDYYGRWKALHYFSKKFYSPVLLSVEETGTNADIYVTNDSRTDVDCRVEWKLRTNTSEVLQEGNVTAIIAQLSAQKVEGVEFGNLVTEDKMRNTYLECQLFIGGEWMSSTTILFTKPKHFEFEDPKLSVEVEETTDAFEIKVQSENFAKYIELDLASADCKFSDNYFDLSAGDIRRITVNKESLSVTMDVEAFRQQFKIRSIFDIE